MSPAPFAGILSVWRRATDAALRRLPLFLAASLALAATNLMLWTMGVYDGLKREEIAGGALVAFLLVKLVLLFAWALASIRLAHDPERPAGTLLRISRRQAGWIGGMLLLVPAMLGLRVALTRAVGAVLEPFGADPKAALAVGAVLYLVLALIVLVQILPAWAGVLVGDREVGLGWSWRATRGSALRSLGLMLGALLPMGAVHFGNNLLWLSDVAAVRAVMLLADGAIMALYVMVAGAAYVTLYERAKARAVLPLSLQPTQSGERPPAPPSSGREEKKLTSKRHTHRRCGISSCIPGGR